MATVVVNKSSLNVNSEVGSGGLGALGTGFGAVVTYVSSITAPTNLTDFGSSTNDFYPLPVQNEIVTRYFGPTQAVPSSFTTSFKYLDTGNVAQTGTMTWTLQSGIVFGNT